MIARRDSTIPAMLSFMIPGLGQVAAKQPLVGVGFFAAFVASMLIPHGHWLIPLVALASSYHAWRLPKREDRDPIFLTIALMVAFAAFFGWMLLFFSRLF